MPLQVMSFEQLINTQVAAMQAAAGVVLDFNVGSILRSIIESNSGNALWLQSEAQWLLAITRLTTSTGNDVDTFVEQFGLTRSPAVPATGFVTLSRYTPNQQGVINVGALVSSATNNVNYSVGIDTTNPYYNPDLNQYLVPQGISSTSVPVTATTAGAIGNVLANQITTIQSVIINMDTVTNPDAFTTGANQESDAALKIRFVLYLNSLSKATKSALQAAILSVPGVARYDLQENEDINGNLFRGFFYAVIDDGTGNASSTLLGNVSVQLEATRGLTIGFAVYDPIQFPTSVTARVTTDLTTPNGTVQTAVVAALQKYISELGFNSIIPYSEIPRVIYDTNLSLSGTQFSPITNVTNWTLNDGISDITLATRQIPVNGTFMVTVNA